MDDTYNRTVHSATGEKPIDKYIKHLDRIKFVSSKQELDYIFLYRVARKVKNDATISLQNILFETPLEYIGQRINLRYDPTSLDKAYIFSDDGQLQETIHPVNKIDNSKIRRKENIKPVDFSSFAAENERS